MGQNFMKKPIIPHNTSELRFVFAGPESVFRHNLIPLFYKYFLTIACTANQFQNC